MNHRVQRCRRVLTIVAGLAACATPVVAAVQTNGPASSLTITTNAVGNRSVVVQLSPTGTVEVTPFAPDVVRVRFHFAGLYDREEAAIAKPFSNWPAFSSTFTNLSSTNFLIETSQLQVELVLSNRFKVHFKDQAGRDLLRDLQIEYNLDYHMIDDTNAYAQVNWPGESTGVSNRPSGFKLKAIKMMPTNEAYFGLGDFGGPLNRRGQVLQFWNQDTYQFGESRNPKYTSLPFWYGVEGPTTARAAFAYGVFFNNPARPVVELTSGLGDTYAFHAGDDQLDYFFFGGGTNHTMQAIIDRFSELTGRPAFLPKWAYGYHQSRHTYFTQQEVQDLATTFRTSDIPCDAIYLDIGVQDGDSQNHQLTFNGGFTNVAGMVSFCTNLGVKLVPIVEPLLTTNDPLYVEARTNLYFIKANNLDAYVGTNFLHELSWLDFSISETRAWWQGKLTNFVEQYGFHSLWNDLNEPNENAMPLDTLWYLDGRYGGGLVTNDTRKWHSNNKNTYGLLESKVSYDALRAAYPSLRPFVLSRSAWPGVQRYAAGWSGDNISSFDQLRFNTRIASSMMISGQANFGNDVGGFVTNAGSHLLTRWLQAGVLNPLYRNHTSLDTAAQEPWVYGEPYTLWNRRWIKFRYELMPYLYTLAHDAATNGMPMNTPTVFQFMSDTNTFGANDYDFMTGRDLLAAPVYSSGAVTRVVYLPSGSAWYGWYDDRRYTGGQSVTVLASLGGLPLFVRAGGIIPMGPSMAYADAATPDHLDLHVWPGATNRFTLYEDDGLTTNYLAGVWATTPVGVAGAGDNLQVTVYARSGSFNPGARDLYVVAHAMSNMVSVTAGGTALTRYANRSELEAAAGDGWCYGTVDRRAIVKVADTGAQTVLTLIGDAQAPSNVPFASSFSNMAVAGTFNYWNEGARNMRLVTNYVWAHTTDLTGFTNVAFKFVGNDAWATTNWGDDDQTNFTTPVAQTAEPGGSNIALSNLTAGVYTFTFNETSRAYAVTSAALVDSDGDGMPDEWEYYYGLHPALASDAAMDLDGDGLANSNEFASGGSPVRSDTDNDGISDAAEFIAGTGLADSNAYFRLQSHTLNSNGAAVVTWSAVTGRNYEVSFATNLQNGSAWSTLDPFGSVTGSGSVSVADTNSAEGRAYRVGVKRLP